MDQTEILICKVLVPSIFCPVLCPSLQHQKIEGGGPTFMILHIMNQVYSACVIQCTIQIFHHYNKSENDNILDIKHTLYICFIIFPLTLWMIILSYVLFYLHCQWERRVIHTKIVYICFTQVCVYGIAYFPFHSVFHSVPFSVPRFSNTPYITP